MDLSYKEMFKKLSKILLKANKYAGNLKLYYADEVIIFTLKILEIYENEKYK